MTNLEKAVVLRPTDSFAELLAMLRDTRHSRVVIVDHESRPIGIIDDKSIRMAMLTSSNDQVLVGDLMQTEFATIDATNANLTPRRGAKKSGAWSPAVDKDGTLLGTVSKTNSGLSHITMPSMLIMAGGFGLRMNALTRNTPKPMLKIRNRPVLEHIIESCKSHHITSFVISVHHMADQIISYFGDGAWLNVSIKYIHETQPLGTGGCFKLVEDTKSPYIVINADILSKIDFSLLLDFHSVTQSDATIATVQHSIKNQYGVVKNSGPYVESMQEKPEWITNINAGIYVVETRLKKYIQTGEKLSMPLLLDRLMKDNGKVACFPIYEDYHDVGSEENYHRIKDAW